MIKVLSILSLVMFSASIISPSIAADDKKEEVVAVEKKEEGEQKESEETKETVAKSDCQ